MNIYDFTNYVNQDVDDTFSVEEIARWFNKAVANFNLIPPVTKFPFINMDDPQTTEDEFEANANAVLADNLIGAYVDYPFSTTFMLGVMLPYVVSAVKSQESSLSEKQLALQEFNQNSRQYKSITNIVKYLQDQKNLDLELYQLGENVYLTDFTTNPFAGEWSKSSAYKEVVIATKNDGSLVKYADNSLVDENVEELVISEPEV